VNGGAINLSKSARANVVASTFDRVQAAVGGAIYAAADDSPDTMVTIDGCTFSGCAASDDGGALFLQGNAGEKVKATISNSVFRANRAEPTSGNGGAVAAQGLVDLAMSNCSLTGNAAASGGGVYIDRPASTLSVAGSVFSGNTAQLAFRGSAIAVSGIAAVISGSSFLGAKQASATLAFFGTGGTPAPIAVDSCLFDAAPLPDETPADAVAVRHVVAQGNAQAVTVTRSTFLNAGGGECQPVLAMVGRGREELAPLPSCLAGGSFGQRTRARPPTPPVACPHSIGSPRPALTCRCASASWPTTRVPTPTPSRRTTPAQS
jgi:hypothetical protein